MHRVSKAEPVIQLTFITPKLCCRNEFKKRVRVYHGSMINQYTRSMTYKLVFDADLNRLFLCKFVTMRQQKTQPKCADFARYFLTNGSIAGQFQVDERKLQNQ
jgi:hypothetical protein